ncbi:MAG: flotillin-like protein FloA [Deltaproteobacteria bacterium]|nr:flotillin-like protein FloA [Deltaproteobacteria bacterium]
MGSLLFSHILAGGPLPGLDLGLTVLVIIFAVIGFLVFLWIIPVRLWIAAWSSRAPIGIVQLIGMRLRRIPPHKIVNPRIMAVKAGLDIKVDNMEAHVLAGGNIETVILALISADKANIELSFERAAAIDLAGRNVFEAVQMSVIPKVITTPKIAAVAKDGIQLMAICRITVRTNIERLVGGAGEETVVARVGEGIVSTIGSSGDYKQVLENPDRISKNVLSKGLDAGTAFEILSIDIADVDVGANIGAKLNTEKAEADKMIAQAQAESRRALAVAAEQEMKANVEEMRARLVEAESKVPIAMADALRKGNLGVIDYYQLKNVMADTIMRQSISSMGDDEKK